MRSATDIIGDFFIWMRKHSEGYFWRWKFYLASIRTYQELSRFLRRVRSGFRGARQRGVCLKYFHGKKNFGDALNVDVMRWMGLPFSVATEDSANLLCIGSLMDELLVTDWQRLRYSREVHVFGAGFMHDRESSIEQFNRPVTIHGLRGKLSLSRCEGILGRSLPHVVLGDPGLLVNEIFPCAEEKQYDVGVICHYNDHDAAALANLRLDGLRVLSIDVHLPTVEFAQKVALCRFILSSALHGIICADAYGVPNRHVLLSGLVEGGGYKFRDYYSVFPSANYAPVDLRERTIDADDVRRWMTEPTVSAAEVATVQGRLKILMRKIRDYAG